MAKVEFLLTGCANGHPVRIEGRGTATGKAVRVRFAAVEAPLTFDTSLALFAGLDAVVALVAGLAVAPDGPLVARLRADLLGEGAVEVGTIAAVATVERRRGGYRCAAQLTEAKVALEVGERVTSVGERALTAVPQGGGVALLSTATVGTSRGRELTVLTTAALVGAEAERQRSLVTLPTKLGRAAVVLRFAEP